MPLDDAQVERALAIAAHPDDLDFGAAGTIAAWVKSGIAVSYCIVTDGDAGGFDPAVDRTDIPGIRQREQRAAAAAVGVADVSFLGHRDGQVVADLALRRDLARQIRRVRPQRVLAPSPERNFERVFASHPDHLATGEAALCAVYPDARNPFAYPELLADEGLEAWVVPEVWLQGAPDGRTTTYVDATDVFDAKLAALRAHVSQTEHMDDLEGLLRSWMGGVAFAGRLAPGRLAEGFQVLDTGE